MAQSTEFAVLGKECKCSDSLRIITYPDAQLVFLPGCLDCLHLHLNLFTAPIKIQNHVLISACIDCLYELLLIGYCLPVDCLNIIASLNNPICRLIIQAIHPCHFSGSNDQNTFSLHIDPNGNAAGNHVGRFYYLHPGFF